jgi:ubiquinone/menaquinone biosynthesis C-methylase UbiE
MIQKARDFFSRPTEETLQGDLKKVAELWGNRVRSEKPLGCAWTDSPLIQQHYIHPTISGNKHSNWLMWVKDTYFLNPVNRALSLGCGDGCLERHGALIDVFRECDAFDISSESIKVAEMKARELGIHDRINYKVTDINKMTLLDSRYDAAFCAMSMHHFENLEHILLEIGNSLKDGGLFIFNEYVGPNRFQWTDKQLGIANELLKLLPEKYRFDPTTGRNKESIERPSIDQMIATDPSEAVRSEDIMSLIEERFDVIHTVEYGGTLLNLVLDNIIVNFDEKSPEDMALLQLIFYVEKLLVRERVLENNFSLIISKKKSGKH